MHQRQVKRFDRVTEAAWYVLSPYINPIDCSEKVTAIKSATGKPYGWKPMNKKENVERFFNGVIIDGVRTKVDYFTKQRLDNHLKGLATYGYRSRHAQPARTGYGISDKQAEALSFSDELGITSKVQRYGHLKMFLLGFDLDAHGGEQDVARLLDVVLSYFPSSYHEPSTGGKGIHVYVKLVVPWNVGLRALEGVVGAASQLIRETAQGAKIQAPFDGIRSLPMLVTKDEAGQIKIEKRCRFLKIPRLSTMDSVKAFHAAPVHLYDALRRMAEKRPSDSHTVIPEVMDGLGESLEERVEEGLREREEEEKKDVLICVPGDTSLPDALKRWANETDQYLRKLMLALFYVQKHRRILSSKELDNLYVGHGLNRTNSETERLRQWEGVVEWISNSFDPSKLGFNFDAYGAQKAEHEMAVARRLGATQVTYVDGKEQRVLTATEIAAMHWYMYTESATSSHVIHRGCFSYGKLQRAYEVLLGKRANRNRIAAIKRTLIHKLNLMRKSGGWIPGMRGTQFSVAAL